MPYKTFDLDSQTSVTIYKRRGSRSLRLSVSADGTVKVSIPYWTPYSAGLQFAQARREWIISQQRPARPLNSGQIIGKQHTLYFRPSPTGKLASRVTDETIIISTSADSTFKDSAVQAVARKACIRALRHEAEAQLPKRLGQLAERYGFAYGSVSVKQLKARWGSCDHQRNIVLNLFLMQLPWECIEYVLLHELTHTRIMQHGPKFWAAMAEVCPDVSGIRRQMRTYQPVLQSQ